MTFRRSSQIKVKELGSFSMPIIHQILPSHSPDPFKQWETRKKSPQTLEGPHSSPLMTWLFSMCLPLTVIGKLHPFPQGLSFKPSSLDPIPGPQLVSSLFDSVAFHLYHM